MKKKNLKWVQWNSEHFERDIWLVGESKTAYQVWKFLIFRMDQYNTVMCSYRMLMEKFSISEDTVRRALKLLRESGYIRVRKSGISNVYTINHDFVRICSSSTPRKIERKPGLLVRILRALRVYFQLKKVSKTPP